MAEPASKPRADVAPTRYYYRRSLGAKELGPVIGIAVGAAVAVGAVTFYIAKLFAERTPLAPSGRDE